MKKSKLLLTLLLSISVLSPQSASAEERFLSKEEIARMPKERVVPETEYQKKLMEFSKPKPGLFNSGDSEYGPNITKNEFQILSELKKEESNRISRESGDEKFGGEYEYIEPEIEISNFGPYNATLSYYFDQQWDAWGDPFVTKDNNIFRKGPNFWGHAALGGENRSTTLEAGPFRNLGWEENAWFRPAHSWVNAWTPGRHKYIAKPYDGTWAELRINGAKDWQYKVAHDFGQLNVGMPYNWKFHAKAGGFYCSEIVAFAWKHAGIDIIPQKDSWDRIWPIDLYNSWRTKEIRGYID